MIGMTMASPIGPLRLVAEDGALAGVYLDNAPIGEARPADPLLARAARQLDEYFRGRRTTFELPLRMAGTPFQRAVWGALRHIPYGATRSYSDIACAVGAPRAVRAVGLANGRNPVPIIVPCHRVIGKGGKLVGYGGGLERKQWLLEHEGARLG